MQLNICRSLPNFQIRICGFGFEPPDLDLDLDLKIFKKVGLGFGLDLGFFKRVDLDLDLKIGLDLDLDLNIAGFANHCWTLLAISQSKMAPKVFPPRPALLLENLR